jgi:hypothetical protein
LINILFIIAKNLFLNILYDNEDKL